MLWKYTRQYLKTHQRQTILFLVFTVLMLMMNFSASILNAYKIDRRKKDNKEQNGIWQFVLFDVKNPEVAKDTPCVLESVAGYDSEEIKIANLEGNFEEVMAIHLLKGRLPEQENEIAICQSRLMELGIPLKINTKISLEFGDYQLVGILDYIVSDINEYYYPQYLVCQDEYQTRNLYIGGQKDNQILDQLIFENYWNQPNYVNSGPELVVSNSMLFLEEKMIYMGQIVMISLLSLILMLNYTYLNLDKRSYDYVLLRGVGALKRQLYFMSFLETTIIFIMALPICFVLTWIMTFIFKSTIDIPSLISFPLILMNLGLGYLIVLSSNFLPVRRSIDNALTAQFDNKEYRLIERPQRKVRKLTFLNIAKIKLKMHIKNSRFLLLIIIGIFSTLFYLLDFNIDLKVMNQKINDYLEEPFLNEEDLKYVSQKDVIKEDFSYQVIEIYDANVNFSSNSYLHDTTPNVIPLTENMVGVLKKFDIEGRLPEKDNEVILQTGYSVNGKIVSFVGEKVEINGKLYTIAGQLMPLKHFASNMYFSFYEREYLPFEFFSSIFIFPQEINQEFDLMETQTLYQYHGREISNSKLERIVNKALKPLKESKILGQQHQQQIKVTINFAMLALLTMYIFGLSQRTAQIKEETNFFKLIGMTKNEISQIYFFESLILNSCGILLAYIIAFFSFGLRINVILIVTFLFFLILGVLLYLLPVLLLVYRKGENSWKSF